MKRFSFYLLITTFLGQTLIAQDSFGFKAGVNFAGQRKAKRMIVSESYRKAGTESIIGYQIGIIYQKHLKKNTSITTGANLSIVGAKALFVGINNTSQIAGYMLKDKVTYLEIPVLFQYHMHRFNLGVGPNLSYKLTSNVEDYPEDWLSDRKTSYNDWDFGVNAIIGYSIDKNIGVAIRYNYGLIDVESSDIWRIQNRYVNISIQYYFPK